MLQSGKLSWQSGKLSWPVCQVLLNKTGHCQWWQYHNSIVIIGCGKGKCFRFFDERITRKIASSREMESWSFSQREAGAQECDHWLAWEEQIGLGGFTCPAARRKVCKLTVWPTGSGWLMAITKTPADRGCRVPDMFENFQGFNKPELRKYKIKSKIPPPSPIFQMGEDDKHLICFTWPYRF